MKKVIARQWGFLVTTFVLLAVLGHVYNQRLSGTVNAADKAASATFISARSSPLSAPNVLPHDSLRPYNEVRLPFRVQNNLLFVDVLVGTKRIDGLIDTGATDVVWPRSLNLEGTLVQSQEGKGQWYDGSVFKTEAIKLSSLRLGDYLVKNLITRRMNRNKPSCMILGTPIFKDRVVTFDWQEQTLILRSSDYDPLRERSSSARYVAHFTWTKGHADSPGLPTIQMQIGGKAAKFVFDTGNTGVAVCRKFSNRALKSFAHSPIHVGNKSFGNPEMDTEYIHNVPMSLAGFRMIQHPPVIPDIQGIDGSLGNYIVRVCRTTIDYPHKRIILEPYKKQALNFK